MIKDQRLVAFHPRLGDALDDAGDRFGEEPYSIQEVMLEPIDMGVWSHPPLSIDRCLK